MTEVIQFWQSINVQLWSLIVSNWILAISVLITIFGYIITLVNNSRGSK